MSRTFYFNGQFVPEEQAVVPVTTHALHYGTGVFEGIRAYYNEEDKAHYIFRMPDHYQRLLSSAKLLFIQIPHTLDELSKLTIELLQKNFAPTDLYIRPLAYKSDPAVGNFNLQELKDGFLIYTVPMGRYLNTDQGISAGMSSWMRIPDNALPPRAKISGGYVNTGLAKTESLLNGFGEALLLDNRGHVVEGSADNVFIIKDEKVFTPPVSDDILVGITRDTAIRLCLEDLNLVVVERSIDRSEIYSADEVFLVGTDAEVTPVTSVDHRPIGNGEVGRWTRQLKDLYFQLVHGSFDKYPELLTKVAQQV